MTQTFFVAQPCYQRKHRCADNPFVCKPGIRLPNQLRRQLPNPPFSFISRQDDVDMANADGPPALIDPYPSKGPEDVHMRPSTAGSHLLDDPDPSHASLEVVVSGRHLGAAADGVGAPTATSHNSRRSSRKNYVCWSLKTRKSRT